MSDRACSPSDSEPAFVTAFCPSGSIQPVLPRAHEYDVGILRRENRIDEFVGRVPVAVVAGAGRAATLLKKQKPSFWDDCAWWPLGRTSAYRRSDDSGSTAHSAAAIAPSALVSAMR
nr:hypothetical protein [Natrinema gelatinilyticum]